MDKIIQGKDVATALRKLADAIESGQAKDAEASCELEFQDVGVHAGGGFVVMGKSATGAVLMTTRFWPEKKSGE